MYVNLSINHNLTESDFEDIDIKSQLEHQIKIQGTKESGWIFDKTNSMKISFYRIRELNGLSYVKTPLRSNAILNNKNDAKYRFIWSILAYLNPCENNHPNRVSNYRQYFNELNVEGFDFSKRFKCSDTHEVVKLNNLSLNIFELSFVKMETIGNMI